MEQIKEINRIGFWKDVCTAVLMLKKNGCIIFNEDTYKIKLEIWERAFDSAVKVYLRDYRVPNTDMRVLKQDFDNYKHLIKGKVAYHETF